MNEETPKNANGIAGKPLYPSATSHGHVFDSFNASNVPAPILEKPNPAETIANLHQEKPIAHIRTLESDIAEAVKAKKTSVVHIAVTEQQKNPVRIVHTDPKRNLYFLILSIFLILGSAIAVTIFYIAQNRVKELPPVIVQKPQVITTELSISIDVSSSSISFSQSQLKIEPRNNAMVGIKFQNGSTTIDAQTFAGMLKTNMPDFLLRSFKPDYIAGLHFIGAGQPFIIFKTNSYDNAFAGMLQWEETILQNLSGPFGLSTWDIGSIKFQDKVVRNKDTRELYDGGGNLLLLYSFTDKETLVITTNEETFKELTTRLTTSKFTQ